MEQVQPIQTPVTHRELLEKGLSAFIKVLKQPVSVTREEMVDLLNFEVTINNLIAQMKVAEGKSPEELLELAKQALKQ
jgi:hypothetical protein